MSWGFFLSVYRITSLVQILLRHHVRNSSVLAFMLCLLLLSCRMRVCIYKRSFLFLDFQITAPSSYTSSPPISSLTGEDLSLLRSLVLVSYKLYLLYLLSLRARPSLYTPLSSICRAWYVAVAF